MINSTFGNDNTAKSRVAADGASPESGSRRRLLSRMHRTMVAVLVPGVAVAAMACASSPRQEETSSVGQAVTAPVLGTAQSFAVLAGSTVTNTGPTIVTGDLGVSPGSAVTGFPPGTVVGGTMQVATAVAAQAQADTTTAYNSLAGQACNTVLTGQDLGGLTLTTGTYCFSSSAQLTGTLTLDAQGDPAAVFVFQIGSTLTTASASVVRVINGGNPCNVYWQVGSSATLGTATTFVGSIVALTSISLTTGATVAGRALARNGAVTMDTNLVSTATCQTALDGGTADGGGTSSGASSSGTSSGASSSGTSSGASSSGTSSGASSSGTSSGASSSGTSSGASSSGTSSGASSSGTSSGASSSGTSSGGHGGKDAGGKTYCGTTCVDFETDAKNCGSCGNVCGSSESCVNATCVNLKTDCNHCGSYDNACKSSESCVSGVCCANGVSTSKGGPLFENLLKDLPLIGHLLGH